jgi:hypothetical protein
VRRTRFGRQVNFEIHLPASIVTVNKLSGQCLLNKNSGKGTAFNSRVFYNKKTGGCESFLYKGKGGNKNNFQSMYDCYNTCER